VLGATGRQGGGLVDALLASPEFHVRAVTRDAKSEKAQALAKKGVEVVEGNVIEPASLKKALTGAYGFFAVTDAWEKGTATKGETEVAKGLVDVAKEAKVTHYIWSTLPNSEGESKGKHKNAVFSNKGKADEYVRSHGEFKYVTYVITPFYYSNWVSGFKPQRNPDGSVTFSLPADENWPVIHGDITELGLLVVNALKNPLGWGNGDYLCFGYETKWRDVMHDFEKHYGVKVTFNRIPRATWAKLFEGADEYAQMFEWGASEYGPFGRLHDVHAGHKAKGSALKTFEEFLKEGQGPPLPPIPSGPK